MGRVDSERQLGKPRPAGGSPRLLRRAPHFAHRTIRVQEGQWVERGALLGLCGNSGYSAQPHIHVQVQTDARIGALTLPFSFVSYRHGDIYHANDLPRESDDVRAAGRGTATRCGGDLPPRQRPAIRGPSRRTAGGKSRLSCRYCRRRHALFPVGKGLALLRQVRRRLLLLPPRRRRSLAADGVDGPASAAVGVQAAAGLERQHPRGHGARPASRASLPGWETSSGRAWPTSKSASGSSTATASSHRCSTRCRARTGRHAWNWISTAGLPRSKSATSNSNASPPKTTRRRPLLHNPDLTKGEDSCPSRQLPASPPWRRSSARRHHPQHHQRPAAESPVRAVLALGRGRAKLGLCQGNRRAHGAVRRPPRGLRLEPAARLAELPQRPERRGPALLQGGGRGRA